MFLPKVVGVLIIVLISQTAYSQGDEGIFWKENHRLVWADFKGIPPVGHDAAAITASGLSYTYSSFVENGSVALDYTVSTYFYPNDSWYKADQCDALTLSHEQLHFDITELYARKMRKQLATIKVTKATKGQIRKIYKKINTELAAYQNAYDTATNYSRDLEKQLEWNKRIAIELNKK
ncbi:DUF922 domain-containing protein [Cellulophaga sp. F20128]|uniref:DUF922 domain-containing protein n=1 Tax=Cellulophaga sp. F20128 TaxID=2926413 RepID=UPI001FF28C8A|nr:DUF922 domain-containing protein [Cellulophaga sp. F20128]MCK0157561.1 DUF922 domain-containing protein [Cellulophaga sp. F20128]